MDTSNITEIVCINIHANKFSTIVHASNIVSIRNVTHAHTVHVPFCSTTAWECSVQSERSRPLLKGGLEEEKGAHTKWATDGSTGPTATASHGTNAHTHTIHTLMHIHTRMHRQIGSACPSSSPLSKLPQASSSFTPLWTAGLTRQWSSRSPPGWHCCCRVVREWRWRGLSRGGWDRRERGKCDHWRTWRATRDDAMSSCMESIERKKCIVTPALTGSHLLSVCTKYKALFT